MQKPTIRAATPADQPRINEIIELSFPIFYRYFAKRSTKNPAEPVLVSESEGEAAGFAKLIEFTTTGAKYGCILWIAVHPRFRRQGIGSQLTHASVDYLRRRGAKGVFASTQRENLGEQTTLARCGFVPIGFGDLRGQFGWHVFSFYGSIWFVPSELVFWRSMDVQS